MYIKDRIIKVGETLIDEDENAFDMVLEALQLGTRPIEMIVSRDAASTKESRKQDKKDRAKIERKMRADEKLLKEEEAKRIAAIRIQKTITLGPGSLGLDLAEDPTTKDNCYVKNIVEHGQGWNLGFMKLDRILEVDGNTIPKTFKAMDTVMEYLQTLQRPCPIVLSRLKSIDDNAPPRVIYPDWFDPTRPLSKEMWGEKIMHIVPLIPYNCYEARWSRSVNYKKSNIKLKKGKNNDTINQGTLVQVVGNHANEKKGIAIFDQLIGIQSADVENEKHEDILNYIQQALTVSGKNRAIVLRFRHNKDKFKLLNPDPSVKLNKNEYIVEFGTHPLDGGLEIIERKNNTKNKNDTAADTADTQQSTEARVHNAIQGSFAATHGITESDTIIGVGPYDVRKVDYPSIFHAIKYADRPVKIRFLRHVEMKLSKKPNNKLKELDVSIKKTKMNKITFKENEEDGGGYIETVKIKPMQRGMKLIGINGIDVTRHEFSYISVLIEKEIEKKKPKDIKFRFGPKIKNLEDADRIEEYDAENDGGVSLRMLLKMKRKYKAAKKETLPEANQYDIEFQEGPIGLQLMSANDDDQLGKVKKQRKESSLSLYPFFSF